MRLVDTHCHLYLKEFESDLDQVFFRAKEAGVSKFYLPAIDSSVTGEMIKLEEKYEESCFAMMGLHPCSVKENYEEELDLVEKWLGKRSFAAVGEIGLDFYWDKTYEKEQVLAFTRQMEWALHYKLPIVIHTRNAMQTAIETVKPFAEKGLKGIFHCFGDSEENAHQITSMGFLLGIGGVLTYKNSGLDVTLKNVDINNIVLETDAPYLSPVPYRGKRNESSYLVNIAQKLADVKGISSDEVAAKTTANAEKLFTH